MGDRFDFAGDERGVSGVVGFILVFAILVILLSINQAQVVPAENSEVEFQHFQEVRDDLVDVRSAILTAGQNDVSQFPTVNLGTDYPPRILAVNPPPASGRLATSDAYNITITDETGTTERIETRFLEYRPNYNELNVGSTWYENSMLYLDERGQGGLVVIEEQGLVVGNDSLRITALQNGFRRSGSGRVSLELYPTAASDVNISALTGDLTVSLPTRLTGADYWTGAFDDEPAFSPTVDRDWYATGVHALNFSVQKEDVTVNTVGVQAMPEGTSAKQNVGMGGGDNDDKTGDPLPENAVAFHDVNGNGNYDSGLDKAYSESDFDANSNNGPNGDFDGENIVLTDPISVSSLDMSANYFTANGNSIESDNGLKISVGRNLNLEGSTLTVSPNGDMTLEASQDEEGYNINIFDAQLRSQQTISASTPGGSLRFNQAQGSNPGTRIMKVKNGNGQNLVLDDGNLAGENGVLDPEVGTISQG